MNGIMRMMGGLNFCEKVMAPRRFGKREGKSPKCTKQAVFEAISSSEPSQRAIGSSEPLVHSSLLPFRPGSVSRAEM